MPKMNGTYRGSQEYHLVFSALINAAQYRGTVTYSEIAELMGLPSRGGYMSGETGHVLGDISEDEHEQGRPMLSAIAVTVNGQPGAGFFALAMQLNRLHQEASEEERLRFWEVEKAAIYAMWHMPIKLQKKADQ